MEKEKNHSLRRQICTHSKQCLNIVFIWNTVVLLLKFLQSEFKPCYWCIFYYGRLISCMKEVISIAVTYRKILVDNIQNDEKTIS